MRNWFNLGLPVAALLASCGGPTALDAGDAWVRLSAVPGRPAAAYFTIKGGPQSTTLHRVTADYAIRAEMHEGMSGSGSGAMSMRPLDSVPVPAGREVKFEPGGRHVMLYDLDRRAKPGKTTMLTLVFDGNQRLYRKAWIVAANQDSPF